MTIVDNHAHDVGIAPACRSLDVSRATWYRRQKKANSNSVLDLKPHRRSPRRLSAAERDRILDVLCSEEMMDRSPRAVYAILLERGEYLCSVRTMYRVLSERRAVRERRPQRKNPEYTVPICCARAPNELWSWDITKLAGPNHVWFNLYVILDVYSRFVVNWLLARRESGILATRFIEHAIQMREIDPTCLTIHSDRGAPMRAKSLVQLMADLDIERSRSRPRVSNDNPYSESQFKTMKYCPQYPGRFGSYESAKSWCATFLTWYNNEHRHEGIGLFTPSDVYTGRYVQLMLDRQRVLDAAFATHPERFVRGRPKAPIIPKEVWINRPNENIVSVDTKSSETERLLSPSGEKEARPALEVVAYA